MRGDFWDAGGVFAGHPGADQRVYGLHAGGKEGGESLVGFCIGHIEAHVLFSKGSTSAEPDVYLMDMKQLLRTTDPTEIAFAEALLRGEGIDCFALDVNMSILEGGLGILPRRLMVRDEDFARAFRCLRDIGLSPEDDDD